MAAWQWQQCGGGGSSSMAAAWRQRGGSVAEAVAGVALVAALAMASAEQWQRWGVDSDGGGNIGIGGGIGDGGQQW